MTKGTGNDIFSNELSDENLAGVVQDFFLAGTETTSTALNWIFLFLATHPDVQAKLHEEIDRVLSGRMPSLYDKSE
jgi:cytochrome P450